MKARNTTRERKRVSVGTLESDAIQSARILKKNHRAEYDRDPKTFRQTVYKAQRRVFRQKPGPRGNPLIAAAARERAQGKDWETLYPNHIENFVGMPAFTRDLAEAGFKRKVNRFLQRHPGLSRRWKRQAGSPGSSDTSGTS